ncbi:UvrD-helicase domain-containing protein [Candidatus Halocynthiibacter alkanivorans]|uniref:UvrD-helicase domain-containing protein n=1 Tax=Candidatus Halocynthiibacter alkanivorans TaxID=2267619 RepID=UPI000DF21BC3|nr:UvrD-helicase domain-containing protein [Candidatus Halocynthiibacter alkanivorans]
MTSNFKIIPANAGAGKTYHLTETLTGWIDSGEVSPEKVLAVTFTEAAAQELRDRIRAELLKKGLVDKTLRLDSAYISTIHGLGQRLLTEHAFAAGGSPAPRLLEEAERDFLIRRVLAGSEGLKPIMANLGRFGFRYNQQGGSAEQQFRDAMLNTINQLLSLGAHGGRSAITNESVAELEKIYGPVEADGKALQWALLEAVNRLLSAFPKGISDAFDKSSLKDTFRRNHADLKRASDPDELSQNWRLWKDLRSLRLSKRGSTTPEGYDALAGAVMAAADGIQHHPGPLHDAAFLLRSLIQGAQNVIEEFGALKRRIGVVDYADMVTGAEALLREDEDVLNAILAEIDCVVIDEFQDTNPVQFAFLWTLARRAKRTILVGDAKQSIMGFQGADVRLTEALVSQNSIAVHHLEYNWRSSAELVRFFNSVSTRLFGPEYHASKPTREQPDATFLEILKCPNGRGSRGGKTRPYHNTAMRIAAMLEDGERIVDPDTEVERPVRPEDIAVLCTTHGQMAQYATALRALNINVQMTATGWWESAAMQLARHAIAFAADPSDSYAALGWLTLGPEAIPLQVAIEQLTEGTLCGNPILRPLAEISSLASNVRTPNFVRIVLEKTGLMSWALSQPNPAQMRADLLRLVYEAERFTDMEVDLLATEGFFGSSPEVFLGWLAERQSLKDADKRPDPAGAAGQGVELVTWFGAKGREWPVVVVAQLDGKFASRAGEIKAGFANFDNLENVLDSARLDWFPKLDVAEKVDDFANHNRPGDERNARRLLYVAMTRARDRLVLEWPEASIGKTQDGENRSYIDFFLETADVALDEGQIRIGSDVFAVRITQGEGECPEIFDDPPETKWPEHLRLGERHAADAKEAISLTPWRQQPSAAEGEPVTIPLRDHTFGPAVTGLGLDSPTARGTAAHIVLRACLIDPNRDLEPVIRASGLQPDKVALLRDQAAAMADWLRAQGFDRLHPELPMQDVAASGAETNAIIDCLAEGPDGVLIIDHKTGPVSNTTERFSNYWPQLEAYAALVRTALPNKKLCGVAVNWVDLGVLTLSESLS